MASPPAARSSDRAASAIGLGLRTGATEDDAGSTASDRALALAGAVARRTGAPCMCMYALVEHLDPEQRLQAESDCVAWAVEQGLHKPSA